jgi:formylglycine-generating enzyme required for sulfatase activity
MLSKFWSQRASSSALLFLGCSLVRSLEDLESGDGAQKAGGECANGAECDLSGQVHGTTGTFGTGGNSAGNCRTDADCRDGGCLNGTCQRCRDGMALVRFADERPFCIDKAEVTQREYQEYLDSTEPLDRSVNECPGHTRREPSEQDGSRCGTPFDPVNTPNLPVACVDLCDAITYCRYRDKHVCSGKRVAPKLNGQSKLNDPIYDAWYRACSGPNHQECPDTNECSSSRCNVDRTSDGVAEVGSFAECTTGRGVLDLSGNVAEWTRYCIDVADGHLSYCYVRGGSFRSVSSSDYDCRTGDENLHPINTRSADIGFRCCIETETQL